MPTSAEQLDLAAGIGQRQASFRFDLVDAATSRPLGTVAPARVPPTLDHDTSRQIARTISGFTLEKADTAAINVISDRVRPVMVVGGDEYPLGTYVFTDSHTTRSSGGQVGDYGLADLGYVVAQPVEHSVSFGPTINVGDAISALLGSVASLPAGYVVDPCGAVLGSPVVWPAGTDRGRILEDLCRLGAYLSPWMNNQSVIRVRQAFDPATEAPTFAFVEGGNVIAGSILESDDLLDAPNAFIITDNATTGTAVVGRYDVPVTAPHSAANRGFVIPYVSDVQGVGSAAAADAAARALGLAHTIHQQVTVSTASDPRHDGYDVIAYDNAQWLETAWSLPLAEGAEMSHTLTRAYAIGDAGAEIAG